MGTNTRIILLPSMLISLFILSGCGNRGGDNGVVPNTPPPAAHSFAGKVTVNGYGLSGVSVLLTGVSEGVNNADIVTAFTNISGNYTFRDLQEGNYVIRPTMNGYNFDPVLYGTSSLASTSIHYDFRATSE